MSVGPRVLLVGAGAIGGVVGTLISARGVPLTVLTTNPAILSALTEHGFRLRGDVAGRLGKPSEVKAVLSGHELPFDWAILAVQPPQLEAAARTALPALAAGGRLVCLQNGLCEERLARIAGSERVVGAVVAWGASMIEPGIYERTSAGGFSIGAMPGAPVGNLQQLAELFEPIGPVTFTDNLLGVRWSKLAINCAVSTLGTLGGERLGTLLRRRFVRRLALEIMTEAALVARAEGVRLEKVAGTLDLSWLALDEGKHRPSLSLAAKHALLLAVGTRYRRLRSSMLSALERGREPAVDFLNGEVTDRAARHGIPVPVNALSRDFVWRIARGEARSSEALLRELYERSRV